MKNRIIKVVAILILGCGILIPCLSIPQIATTSKGDVTLISEETGAFSEIETEEETTIEATTKLQETLSKKEIFITTTKENTTSSALKSKKVTVTEMATEKTTAPTTVPAI